MMLPWRSLLLMQGPAHKNSVRALPEALLQGEISVYTWDDGDEFITDGGLELIPDEILEKENVQDLINSLKKKEDEV